MFDDIQSKQNQGNPNQGGSDNDSKKEEAAREEPEKESSPLSESGYPENLPVGAVDRSLGVGAGHFVKKNGALKERTAAPQPERRDEPKKASLTSFRPPAATGPEEVKPRKTDSLSRGEPKEAPRDIKEPKESVIEDIFKETEGPAPAAVPAAPREKPAIFRPKERTRPREQEIMKEDEAAERQKSGIFKKLLVIILLFIGFAVILALIYYGYGYFIGKEEIIMSPEELPREESQEKTQEDGEDSFMEDEDMEEEMEEEEDSSPLENMPERDTDRDGLSDREELENGTSITEIDSDGDGLFDLEEVKLYKTDPLNPDTDGDGYLDGAEVEAGYNPNGEGRLPQLEIDSENDN